MPLPTPQEITSLYLYGTKDKPINLVDDALIRPTNIVPKSYVVDVNEFMDPTTGPGRFAVGSQFEIVDKFFNDPDSKLSNLQRGRAYTKEEIKDVLGLGGFFGYSFQQKDVRDNFDDYIERTYIFNSTNFQVSDSARFIVRENGTKIITNFSIEPQRNNYQDDFDFISGTSIVNYVNQVLEKRIDPFKIGRTVNINYTEGSTPKVDYTIESFNADKALASSWQEVSLLSLSDINRLQEGMFELADFLFSDGTTRTLDTKNRPIIYGTHVSDLLFVNLRSTPEKLNPFFSNGVVVLGGQGADSIVGGPLSTNDELYGGAGNDNLAGLDQNDILSGDGDNDSLDGGAGERDIALYSGSRNEYQVIISDDLREFTISHMGGRGFDGTDTLINVEYAQFKDETITLTQNIDSKTLQVFPEDSSNFEGDNGVKQFTFNVMRTGDTSETLTISYSVSGSGDNPAEADDFITRKPVEQITVSGNRQVQNTGQELDVQFSLTETPIDDSTLSLNVAGLVSLEDTNSSSPSSVVNVAYVIDVSGSTAAQGFSGATSVGDLNGDGDADEIIDAQIAAFEALTSSLAELDFASQIQIGIIPFSGSATVLATFNATEQTEISNTLRGFNREGEDRAEINVGGNTILDGGTDFEDALSSTISFFNTQPEGANFVFFLSDGTPSDGSGVFADELATLKNENGINATIQAFPVGENSSVNDLNLIDDGVITEGDRLLNPEDLTAAITRPEILPEGIQEVQILQNAQLVATIPASDLVPAPLGGFEFSTDISGLDPNAFNTIETRVVATDADATTAIASQTVTPVNTIASASPDGQITFAPGESSTTITVNVAGDNLIEEDEEFTVTLSGVPSEYEVTQATASGVIINDDFEQEEITQEKKPDEKARSKGEPHLTTFDGVGYSFQGAGEFTLVKSTEAGDDFNVQVRYVEIDSSATVASAVATVVDGKEVVIDSGGIEFEDGRPVVRRRGRGEASITIDGVTTFIADGEVLAIENSKLYRQGNQYTIVYAGANGTTEDFDDQLVVNYLRPGTINIVDVYLSEERKDKIEGLLGNLNDDPTDDIALADGTPVERTNGSVAFSDLYGAYREDWRVKDVASSLFKTNYELYADIEGVDTAQGPDIFYNSNFPENPVRFKDLPEADRTQGIQAARDAGYQFGTFEFWSAAFDFAITKDLGFLEGNPGETQVTESLSVVDDRGTNGGSTNPTLLPTDFIGTDIQFQVFFPSLNDPIRDPITATVGDAIEFSRESIDTTPEDEAFQGGYSIDIAANSITYTAVDTPVSNPVYSEGNFNGFVFTDIDNTLPAIKSVTLDQIATTFGDDNSDIDITFTEDTIELNLEDIAYTPGEIVKLDVSFLHPLDDAYETNDTADTAYDLRNNENQWLSSISGFGRQYDDDWYTIIVAPGNRQLTVDLEFAHADGDIDISVYDADKNFVTSSSSVTDNEQISTLVPTAGDYYLKVHFADAGNSYDLRWRTDAFIDDAYEDNNTQDTAYDLSSNAQTWLRDVSGLGIAGNDDWYQIDIASGFEHLVVDLDFIHENGDLELSLYDTNGSLITSSFSSTDDERLETIVPAAGTYYLEVDSSAYQGNSYDLRWEALSFEDDAYEENNSQAAAYDLGNDERTWLTALDGSGIAGNEDWYQIDITLGYEHLVVDLDFIHDENDLNLTLYDADSNFVTSSFSATDDERIETILPAAGTYYLQIDTVGDYTGSSYDLWWDDLRFEDDAYEDNNSQSTAYDLSGNVRKWLTAVAGFGVAGNEDWYELEVSPGAENLLVDLQFSHDSTDLGLSLYDADGNYVTGAFSTTDDEELDVVVEDAGAYYIQVSTNGDYTGSTYDLWWDDIPVVDDAYEENDDLLGAYDLKGSADTWLSELSGTGITRDEDWYAIEVAPGFEQVIADTRFIHSNGDIELTLYDADGVYVTGATSSTDNEQIDTIVSNAGTYYLQVREIGAGGNTYDLRWTTETV